jgi:hypothetical protein
MKEGTPSRRARRVAQILSGMDRPVHVDADVLASPR